jgi:putative iron-only hydrogenase system regulator
MAKIILGTISILIKDRHNRSAAVNALLTERSHLIRARLGVNVEPKCAADCLAVISLVVEGEEKEINELTKKLDNLPGVKAGSYLMLGE